MREPKIDSLLKGMTRQELCILLKRILKYSPYGINRRHVLSARWEGLADQAQRLRKQAVGLMKNHHFADKEYQDGLILWDKADRIDKKADVIFQQMEEVWNQSSRPNAQPG
jgi:hypothetical protein